VGASCGFTDPARNPSATKIITFRRVGADAGGAAAVCWARAMITSTKTEASNATIGQALAAGEFARLPDTEIVFARSDFFDIAVSRALHFLLKRRC
jgi:hypothetical protein